jgi:hypothetical protein
MAAPSGAVAAQRRDAVWESWADVEENAFHLVLEGINVFPTISRLLNHLFKFEPHNIPLTLSTTHPSQHVSCTVQTLGGGTFFFQVGSVKCVFVVGHANAHALSAWHQRTRSFGDARGLGNSSDSSGLQFDEHGAFDGHGRQDLPVLTVPV